MSWRNTSTGYGAPSRALHWLMALLIVGAYVAIEFHEIFPRGSGARSLMVATHFTCGLSIGWLVWLRIASRFAGEAPQIRPAPPHWQHLAAKGVHGLLYLMMIAMPILGWLTANADGHAVSYFGLTLPSLVGANEELAETLGEIHETIGNIGMLLIAGHVAAAIYHHRVQKDNTMLLMLPESRR